MKKTNLPNLKTISNKNTQQTRNKEKLRQFDLKKPTKKAKANITHNIEILHTFSLRTGMRQVFLLSALFFNIIQKLLASEI